MKLDVTVTIITEARLEQELLEKLYDTVEPVVKRKLQYNLGCYLSGEDVKRDLFRELWTEVPVQFELSVLLFNNQPGGAPVGPLYTGGEEIQLNRLNVRNSVASHQENARCSA